MTRKWKIKSNEKKNRTEGKRRGNEGKGEGFLFLCEKSCLWNKNSQFFQGIFCFRLMFILFCFVVFLI